MTAVFKRLRYYYWLIASFVEKNKIILVISFFSSFLLIFLAVNSFPFLNTVFFKKKYRVGIVGRYQLDNVPAEITNAISNPLIRITDRGELVPVLASSWEIVDEGTTYIIHLKPNLLWSDGKQFSARDLSFNFEGIETIIVDDVTIKFKLNSPLSIFPIYLTKPVIRFPLKGVGGEYKVHSYKLNNRYVSHINLLPIKPEEPYRSYLFYDTDDGLITAYKKGKVSSMTTTKKSISDQFTGWKNTNVTRSVNYNKILTLFFNTESDLLSDRNMRKALVYASPRFDQLGVEATGPIPPASWAFKSDIKKYTYDIEKAKTYLQEDKQASGPAELDLYTFYDYISIGEALKKSYADIGVTVNLKVLSYVPDSFDMLLTLWSPPTDPDQYYFWHSTQKNDNITSYKNVRIDKLLEDGRKIINYDERKKIYADFQQVIVDDLPAYFMFYPYVYTIERK